MAKALTQEDLLTLSQQYQGTCGESQGNRPFGFMPAFRDDDTGKVYLSCQANGIPAPVHLIEGLPDELVLERGDDTKAVAVKPSLLCGFIYQGYFYTRDECIALLANDSKALAV